MHPQRILSLTTAQEIIHVDHDDHLPCLADTDAWLKHTALKSKLCQRRTHFLLPDLRSVTRSTQRALQLPDPLPICTPWVTSWQLNANFSAHDSVQKCSLYIHRHDAPFTLAGVKQQQEKEFLQTARPASHQSALNSGLIRRALVHANPFFVFT